MSTRQQKKGNDHFSSIARVFSRRSWVHNQAFIENLASFADYKGVKLVLEVGIGTGGFQKALNLLNTEYFGIDISAEMLSETSKNYPNDFLVQANAHNLPIKASFFDLVCCRNLLKHCDEVSSVVSEMLRICKAGGKVLIVESCALNEQDKEFMDHIITISEPYQRPYLTATSWINFCQGLGLGNIRYKVFKHDVVSTTEYRREQYKMSDEVLAEHWSAFANAPKDVKALKNIQQFRDGELHFYHFWIAIEGIKN